MVTGRVLQFDQARGYGFVAADDGGEDVFLHASVFDGDSDDLAPGTRVEFKVMAGDRGRKAFGAHLADEEPAPADKPALSPQPVPSLIPSHRPTPTPTPAQASSALAAHVPGQAQVADDDQLCDVLSSTEFGQELTELLLANVPTLTGQQILEVRQGLLECARKHGWVDI